MGVIFSKMTNQSVFSRIDSGKKPSKAMPEWRNDRPWTPEVPGQPPNNYKSNKYKSFEYCFLNCSGNFLKVYIKPVFSNKG